MIPIQGANSRINADDESVAPVPLPVPALLLLSALTGLGVLRIRQRSGS